MIITIVDMSFVKIKTTLQLSLSSVMGNNVYHKYARKAAFSIFKILKTWCAAYGMYLIEQDSVIID